MSLKYRDSRTKWLTKKGKLARTRHSDPLGANLYYLTSYRNADPPYSALHLMNILLCFTFAFVLFKIISNNESIRMGSRHRASGENILVQRHRLGLWRGPQWRMEWNQKLASRSVWNERASAEERSKATAYGIEDNLYQLHIRQEIDI